MTEQENKKQPNDEEQPEDLLEESNENLRDAANSLNENIEEIIDSLREGNPVSQEALERAQEDIYDVLGETQILQEELNKLK